MIFQDALSALNPVMTVGRQLDEVYLRHFKVSKKEARERSIEALKTVGIPEAERRYGAFPHELSGGMRQRVLIAMAFACRPELIIADEPTTALDVTIQAQVLEVLSDMQKKHGTSLLLITHDLSVVVNMADEIYVMYCGKIVEKAAKRELFTNPLHPYTQGLQKSKPTMQSSEDKLFNIPGNVPNPVNMPDYCYFKERCSQCVKACSGAYPNMIQVSPTHFVACHLYETEDK